MIKRAISNLNLKNAGNMLIEENKVMASYNPIGEKTKDNIIKISKKPISPRLT